MEKEIETTMEQKIVLNERQIKILEEAELPTVYDELPLSQKSAIESIEDFLVYLEDKYGETFCYDGYVPDGFGEREHIIAYAESDSRKRTVTAYRKYEDGKFIYEDDYQNILAEEDYKNALKAFINQYLDEKDYKLFVEIDEVKEGWTQESVVESVEATNLIFYCNKSKNIDEFIKLYGDWMKDKCNGMPSETSFIIQDRENFNETEQNNYNEKIYSRKYSEYISCILNANGKISINTWE